MKAAACCLAIVFGVIACESGQNPSLQPEILIASDIPLSAFVSKVIWEQAIGYAIGRQPTLQGYRLGYWSLDDTLGAEQSQLRGRENVRQMIADRRVLGMVGPVSSFVAKVEMPEANRAHLAMVSPTTTSACLTVDDPDCSPTASALRPSVPNNFFRITPRDPLQGKAMAQFAATQLGRKRVVAFNEFGPQGRLYIREFSDELRSLGGAVLYQQDLPDGTQNFSAFLSHARDLNADAVYAVADADGCKAAVQMAGFVPGAVFLGQDGMTLDRGCIGNLGESGTQVWATYPSVDPGTSSDPAVARTVAAYLKAYPFRFDANNYTPYIFAAFDSARILIEAIARAIQNNGGAFPGRPDVLAALTQPPEFAGLTGKYSFDKNGDALRPMMSIYKVDAGQWKFVQVSDTSSS